MRTSTWLRAAAVFLGAAVLSAMAGAQSASPSPAPAASPANTEAGALPAATAAPAAGNPMIGTWKVERAVFELFGTLKDVTGQDERFYSQLRLDQSGKGGLRYGAKPDETEIEFEVRNGSTLTVAFGSRLKPQIDLYNLLILSDGTLFLRSTRLAQVNGTVTYLLRRSN